MANEEIFINDRTLIYDRMVRNNSETGAIDSKNSENEEKTESATISIDKTTNEDELVVIDSKDFDDEDLKETEDSKDEKGTSLSEFKKFIENNQKIKKAIGDKDIKELFKALDADGDNYISQDEIQAISKSSNDLEDVTAGEFVKYIKNLKDENDDEEIPKDIIERLKSALGLNSDDNETENLMQTPSVQNIAPTSSSGSYYPSVAGGSYSGGVSGSASASPSVSAATQAVQEKVKSELEAIEEEINTLETNDIPQTEKEIAELQTTKDANIKEQEEIQEKAIEESEEIDSELKEKYKDIEDNLVKTKEEKSEKETEKSEKESESKSLEAEISGLDAQISAIDTNTENEEVNKQNQAKINELKQEKESLEAKKKELDAEIETLEEEISKLEDKIEEYESEKEKVLEEIKENLDPNSPLLKTIEESEEKIKEIEATYQTEAEEKNNTLEEQRTRLEELKIEKGKLEGEAQNVGELATELENSGKFTGGVLAGKGKTIEEICNKYGVDPYLVTAIMAHETGYGTSDAIINKNNPGGMMDPSTGCSTLQSYATLDEGIEAVVRNLSKNYIGQGLNTISSIGQKYCPVGAANDPTGLNGNWVPAVTRIYNELSGKNVEYNTILS